MCFFFPPLKGEVESHSITQASLKLHKGGLETLLASCILGLQVSINVPCSFFYLPLSPFFDSSCQVSKQIQTHNQTRFYKNPQSLKLKNHDSLSSDETIETLSSKWKCCRSQEQSRHYPQDSHLRLHRLMSECKSYLKNVLATNVFGSKWKYSLRNYQLNTSGNIPSGTQNFSKITLCSSNIRLLPSHDQNNSS